MADSRMGGWVRLFVFLTGIWSVIVFGYSGYYLLSTYNNEDYLQGVLNEISEGSQEFYTEVWNPYGIIGPLITIDVNYTDGTWFQSILGIVETDEVQQKIDWKKRDAKNDGKEISEEELSRIRTALLRESALAKKASYEFDLAVSKRKDEKSNNILRDCILLLFVLIGPPIVIFILGSGVAWVRAGFNRNN